VNRVPQTAERLAGWKAGAYLISGRYSACMYLARMLRFVSAKKKRFGDCWVWRVNCWVWTPKVLRSYARTDFLLGNVCQTNSSPAKGASPPRPVRAEVEAAAKPSALGRAFDLFLRAVSGRELEVGPPYFEAAT